jgi:hypothetical protein
MFSSLAIVPNDEAKPAPRPGDLRSRVFQIGDIRWSIRNLLFGGAICRGIEATNATT